VFEQERLDYHLYLSPIERGARLPWDHIDTGIKKSYLIKELDKALKEEYTQSCLDDSCGTCKGCMFPHLLEREFPEKAKISSSPEEPLGEEAEEEVLYRVFYSKLRSARFISHKDLNNIIQRALRRAGFQVVYSEGFHPKMIISYPSALPLGMRGKQECFEFKSRFLYTKGTFISRMNACLPSGIRVLRLERREVDEPSLNKVIDSFVYSVSLKSREMEHSVEDTNQKKMSSPEFYKKIEKLVEIFLTNDQNEFIQDVVIDRKKAKLFIHLTHSVSKSISAQKIVKDMFKIEKPAFIMVREKIEFKPSQKTSLKQ
jgi:radical SAM-linked protein